MHAYLVMQLLSKSLQTDKAPQRIHDSDNCFCESFRSIPPSAVPWKSVSMIVSKVADMTVAAMESNAVKPELLFKYVRKYKLLDAQELAQAEKTCSQQELVHTIETRLTAHGSGFSSFKFSELARDKLLALTESKLGSTNPQRRASISGVPPSAAIAPAPGAAAVPGRRASLTGAAAQPASPGTLASPTCVLLLALILCASAFHSLGIGICDMCGSQAVLQSWRRPAAPASLCPTVNRSPVFWVCPKACRPSPRSKRDAKSHNAPKPRRRVLPPPLPLPPLPLLLRSVRPARPPLLPHPLPLSLPLL